MIYIDKYAYISALKDTKPELKLLFGVSTLLVSISSISLVSFVVILLSMTFMTICKAKIPFGYYMKLIILPFGFLFLSIIGIIVNISGNLPIDSIWSLSILNLYVSISPKGINLAIHLIFKSLASISCMYFIILTTPIRDIIAILHLLKFPSVIITLLTFIYQFIFLLMETSITKLKSQQCRHGYNMPKKFIKNVGMLWASVFVQSYISSQWIYKAMEVRGHNENIKFISRKINIKRNEFFMICIFLAGIISLNFLVI